MSSLLALFRSVVRDESGQDLIEYALMAALVATGTGILMPATVVPAISTMWVGVRSVLVRCATN